MVDGLTPKYSRSTDNITPIHNFVQVTGTGTTLTSLIDFKPNNFQGFNDLQLTGTSLTLNSLKTSGYQYLSNTHVVSTEDTFDLLDNLLIYYTVYADETMDLYEATNTGHVIQEDLLDLLEDTLIQYTVYCEEVIDFTEQYSALNIIEEIFPIIDDQLTIIKKTFTEVLNLTELTDPFLFFDVVGSHQIDILVPFIEDGSTSQEIVIIDEDLVSTQIAISPFNLVAVTGASSVGNPFEPTIIVGGVTYVTNPSTAPDPSYVVTADTYFVRWLNAGIGGANACDILNFNFNLDYSGGTFSITSQEALGGLGDVITIFGLRGTITESGYEVSQGTIGYRVSGIFGNPNLNKQLQFLVYGNQYFLKLLSSQNLTGAPTNSWQTVKAAAFAIAQVAGINLAWSVADAPLTDLFAQASSTGYEALSSLAGMVGATLRWNGNNHYQVAYPTQHAGEWFVPHSELITESGVSYQNILDLEYGVSGTGAIAMQVYDTFDSTATTLPGGGGPTQADGTSAQSGMVAPADIQVIASTSKPFTAEDPPLVKDLPLDMAELYIQILVTPEVFNQSAGPGSPPITGTTLTGIPAGRFITTDSNYWFNLGNLAISNPYVRLTSIGGNLKPQLRADYTLFPNLSAVNNGNFVMSFGITRKDLGGDFIKAQEDAEQAQKNLLARTQDAFRFVKVYDGNINSYFFGSIPLPGMQGSGTACSNTVSGIIESVSFSSPGLLAVRVARYKKINFIHNKLTI